MEVVSNQEAQELQKKAQLFFYSDCSALTRVSFCQKRKKLPLCLCSAQNKVKGKLEQLKMNAIFCIPGRGEECIWPGDKGSIEVQETKDAAAMSHFMSVIRRRTKLNSDSCPNFV
jgi:hypothetical protein